jgi:hypothetical protein
MKFLRRESSGNLDSVIRGSLAYPIPSNGATERSEAMKKTKRNLGAAFKAQVALTTVKGDKTLAELAAQFTVDGRHVGGKAGIAAVLGVAFVIGAVGVASGQGRLGSGEPPPMMTVGQTVIGQIVVIDEDHCVIRTELGDEVTARIASTTFLPEPLKPGDKVEAVVLADHIARSIVQLH